jgi:hypothetical protein
MSRQSLGYYWHRPCSRRVSTSPGSSPPEPLSAGRQSFPARGGKIERGGTSILCNPTAGPPGSS